MLNFEGPGGLNLAGGRKGGGGVPLCVCVCVCVCVCEAGRHLISVKVLHLLLLLLSAVCPSLTKLWLWTDVPQLKQQSSPISTLINLHFNQINEWKNLFAECKCCTFNMLQCIRVLFKHVQTLLPFFLSLFCHFFPSLACKYNHGQSSWTIRHAWLPL